MGKEKRCTWIVAGVARGIRFCTVVAVAGINGLRRAISYKGLRKAP
jgi:hypothetical protein